MQTFLYFENQIDLKYNELQININGRITQKNKV